jgi:hypothetical protein
LIGILAELDRPETKLAWRLAPVHAALGLFEECFALQWWDIEYQKNQNLARRAWSKGKETAAKTKGSMKPVATHPGLAEYLKEWRNESPARIPIGSSLPFARREVSRGRHRVAAGIIYVQPQL